MPPFTEPSTKYAWTTKLTWLPICTGESTVSTRPCPALVFFPSLRGWASPINSALRYRFTAHSNGYMASAITSLEDLTPFHHVSSIRMHWCPAGRRPCFCVLSLVFGVCQPSCGTQQFIQWNLKSSWIDMWVHAVMDDAVIYKAGICLTCTKTM